MQLGIHDLAREQRVLGQIFAGEYAFLIVLLGFMANDDHDSVSDIDARVIVIMIVRGGNSVARKDNCSTGLPVSTEAERYKIDALFEFFRLPAGMQRERIAIAQGGSRRNLKVLKIIPSQVLEPGFRKLCSDVIRRLVQLGRAG